MEEGPWRALDGSPWKGTHGRAPMESPGWKPREEGPWKGTPGELFFKPRDGQLSIGEFSGWGILMGNE
jgi:hypothetical protein